MKEIGFVFVGLNNREKHCLSRIENVYSKRTMKTFLFKSRF